MKFTSIILTLLAACFAAQQASAEPLVFKSTRPGASEADAVVQAREELSTSVILPIVRDRVQLMFKQQKMVPSMPSDESLTKLIVAAMNDGKAIKGHDVSVESRPYGSVYYATLTIDPTSTWLDGISRSAAAVATRDRDRDFTSWASIAALVGVISVVYFASNLFTKGYYRCRLRLFATAAVVLGVAAVAAMFWSPQRLQRSSQEVKIERAWQN